MLFFIFSFFLMYLLRIVNVVKTFISTNFKRDPDPQYFFPIPKLWEGLCMFDSIMFYDYLGQAVHVFVKDLNLCVLDSGSIWMRNKMRIRMRGKIKSGSYSLQFSTL